MGYLNVQNEVLSGDPKYTIKDSNDEVIYANVDIEQVTPATVNGTPLDKALFDELEKHLVPLGAIIMWSGTILDIPEKWHLCDGTNGTPDLRNRFIVGAGDEYNVGATGGEKEHRLTIDELPSHNHTYSTWTTTGGVSAGGGRYAMDGTTTKNTGNTGGGQAHENRPPYYALAYIMKIA